MQADGPPDPSDQLLLGQLLLQANEPQLALLTPTIPFSATILAMPTPGWAKDWRPFRLATTCRRNTHWPKPWNMILITNRPASSWNWCARCCASIPRFVDSRWRSAPDESPRRSGLPSHASPAAPLSKTTVWRRPRRRNCRQLHAAAAQEYDPVSAGNDCGAQQPSTALHQRSAKAGEHFRSRLRKNPDALEPTMQYVFEVERSYGADLPDDGPHGSGTADFGRT